MVGIDVEFSRFLRVIVFLIGKVFRVSYPDAGCMGSAEFATWIDPQPSFLEGALK